MKGGKLGHDNFYVDVEEWLEANLLSSVQYAERKQFCKEIKQVVSLILYSQREVEFFLALLSGSKLIFALILGFWWCRPVLTSVRDLLVALWAPSPHTGGYFGPWVDFLSHLLYCLEHMCITVSAALCLDQGLNTL